MMLDIYANMDPNYIDYTLIDPPLRKLIEVINKSSWAKTIGSCAGKAFHKEKGGFYLAIEVKGIKGIRNLLQWLSLSHALGFKACHKEYTLKDFALSEVEIVYPNLLHGKDSASRPLMGWDWFKFHIRLYRGGKPLNKVQTEGGIKALELGWNNLENKANKKIK